MFTQLVEHLAHMSRKSPIYDSVGCELDGEAEEDLELICKSQPRTKTVEQAGKEWKSRHQTDICSLKIVQDLASAQAKVSFFQSLEFAELTTVSIHNAMCF